MRGWFHLVSAIRADPNPPTCRAFSKKRLKGFEPSTFCMAIRPTFNLRPAVIMLICRGFAAALQRAEIGNACGYAPICSHSGTHAHECPKCEVAV